MAIPVHIPYDEGLVGQIAGPDHGAWVRSAQSAFQLAGLLDTALHQSFDLADEGDVVGWVQEERGPLPARPQRFHLAERAGRRERIAAGAVRFDLAGSSQKARSA